MSRWAVWSLPSPVLALILVVELLAAAALIVGTGHGVGLLPQHWPWTLGVLAVAGIVSTEASRGVERVRQRTDETPHIDLSSVWAFAAAVLLPGPLATVVVLVIYAHLYARCWRRSGVPPHRVVFSTATVVLAVQAAAAVVGQPNLSDQFRTSGGVLSILLALLAYAAVNMVLVVAVIVLSGPTRDLPTFLHVLGRSDEAVLEFATLSMGALAAGAMSAFGPAYAVLVLPPLILLHRTVLVRQLEEAASTDSKTGLLNAAAWHVHADRALRRSERADAAATVLVLDLDHFKLINDRHGHLVGDEVLAAVADAVRAEVREEDLVGRFGGEEFVVLLAGLDAGSDHCAAEAVAERIRRRIADLRVEVVTAHGRAVVDDLTVSIGGATLSPDGGDLPQLLEAADTAMYVAKRAGRNTVRMGPRSDLRASRAAPPRPTPQPRP